MARKKSNLNRGKSVHPIPLADLIEALKHELKAAAIKGRKDKMFRVNEVTVDIGVRFSRSSKLGGSIGITAEIVDSAESSHRLQIKLLPAPQKELDKLILEDPDTPLVQGPGGDN